MTLVEREPQLDLLRTTFQESAAGGGRVVVVGGRVGMGKTALLESFAGWAARRGATVLAAAGSRGEAGLPLGLIAQLLSHAPSPLPLPSPSPHSMHRLLSQVELSALAEERRPEFAIQPVLPMLHDISLFLLDLVKQTQVLLAVDDVQYADLASLYCLSHLIRRMRSTRTMTMLSASLGSGWNWAHHLLHAEILRQPNSRYLRLEPLSSDGVRVLLQHQRDAPVQPDLVRAVHVASGGSPLLASALIEDNQDRAERHGQHLPGGEALDQATLSCLYRLEPSLIRLAETLAVLDEDVPSTVLSKILGVEPEVLASGLAALEEVGLFHADHYRHPRMRMAILGQISPADRTAIHTHAAHLLHDDHASASAVARQVLAAGPIKAPWLVDVMNDAAERAFDSGDTEMALTILRRATEYPVSPQQRMRLTATLARVEWWVNPALAARHLDELVAAARDGQLQSRAAPWLVSHLLWHGRCEDAQSMIDAIDDYRSLDGMYQHQLLLVQITVSYVFPSCTPLFPDLDPLGVYPDRTPDRDVAHGIEFLLRGKADDLAASLAPALLGALMWVESLDSLSDTELDQEDAATSRPPTWRALVAAVRGESACRRGDFDAAVRHCRKALTILPARGWGVFAGVPLTTLLMAATEAGRPELAADHLTELVSPEMLTTVSGTRFLHARAQYYLLSGRIHEAIADLWACRDITAAWPPSFATVVPWWMDAARACMQLGWPQQARETLREGLSRLGPGQPKPHRTALRSLTSPAVPEHGRHPRRRTVLGRPTDQDDGLNAVIDDLHQALLGVEDIAGRPAAPARPSEGASPADSRDSGPDITARPAELTDAERKVAYLASLGRTNREIAERLHITVSTVEQHLTRVYRKLGIAGRKSPRAHLAIRSRPPNPSPTR